MRRFFLSLLLLVLLPTLTFAYPTEEVMDKGYAASTILLIEDGYFGCGTAVHLWGPYFLSAAHLTTSDGSSRISNKIKFKIKGHYATVVDHGVLNTGASDGGDWMVLKCEGYAPSGETSVCFEREPNDYIFRVGNDDSEGLMTSVGVVGSYQVNKQLWSMDCSSRPGGSGGGVFNVQGELIGIFVQRNITNDGPEETHGYFVPVSPQMFLKAPKE